MLIVCEPPYSPVHELEALLPEDTPRNFDIKGSDRNQNPWYVLATSATEPRLGIIDYENITKNRIIWNRLMCGDLPDEQKVELSDKLKLPSEDFIPLGKYDWENLKEILGRCSPSNEAMTPFDRLKSWNNLPAEYRRVIDLGSIEFSQINLFNGYIFNGIARFSCSVFSSATLFSGACFLKRACFSNSVFNAPVYFEKTYFCENADFTSSKFKSKADFKESRFDKMAVFKGCEFDVNVDFSNTTFFGTTSFHKTKFKSSAPRFFNSNLYEDTIFSTNDKFWPEARSVKSKDHERTYARIRKYMNDIKKPDEEVFFHKLEMREKASSQDPINSLMIRLYDFVSIFGQSVSRPLVGLALLIFFGWLLISPWARFTPASSNALVDGLIWSLSNSLPFVKSSAVVKFSSEIPPGIRLFSVFQSIGSAIFLFLVILAIRNKFRLK